VTRIRDRNKGHVFDSNLSRPCKNPLSTHPSPPPNNNEDHRHQPFDRCDPVRFGAGRAGDIGGHGSQARARHRLCNLWDESVPVLFVQLSPAFLFALWEILARLWDSRSQRHLHPHRRDVHSILSHHFQRGDGLGLVRGHLEPGGFLHHAQVHFLYQNFGLPVESQFFADGLDRHFPDRSHL